MRTQLLCALTVLCGAEIAQAQQYPAYGYYPNQQQYPAYGYYAGQQQYPGFGYAANYQFAPGDQQASGAGYNAFAQSGPATGNMGYGQGAQNYGYNPSYVGANGYLNGYSPSPNAVPGQQAGTDSVSPPQS